MIVFPIELKTSPPPTEPTRHPSSPIPLLPHACACGFRSSSSPSPFLSFPLFWPACPARLRLPKPNTPHPQHTPGLVSLPRGKKKRGKEGERGKMWRDSPVLHLGGVVSSGRALLCTAGPGFASIPTESRMCPAVYCAPMPATAQVHVVGYP